MFYLSLSLSLSLSVSLSLHPRDPPLRCDLSYDTAEDNGKKDDGEEDKGLMGKIKGYFSSNEDGSPGQAETNLNYVVVSPHIPMECPHLPPLPPSHFSLSAHSLTRLILPPGPCDPLCWGCSLYLPLPQPHGKGALHLKF
jgi:hypothetical protein